MAATPRARARPQTGCQVGELFTLLGKPHVLDILYLLLERGGPVRFVDLQKPLGLSPNTLSERLRELVGAGLLLRTAYQEIPPRVDYALTPKALELRPIFDTIERWSTRNDLRPVPEAGPGLGVSGSR